MRDTVRDLLDIIFKPEDNEKHRVFGRRQCTSAGNLLFRTAVLAVTVLGLTAEVSCLQLSIDPVDGSVHILREKRALSAPAAVREFRECGGNLTALSLPARIYSPGYPRSYDSSQFCRWFITADADIKLRFIDVKIEESSECEFDNAEVFVGPGQTSLGKVCGEISNYTLATNSTAVTLVFKSDETYEEKGFVLEFYKATGGAGLGGDECVDTLRGEEGNLTSPGYPSDYPHDANCWTLISVDPGRVVILSFKDIALEFNELCIFDYVDVFDGPTEESPSLGRFCGDSQKRLLRSTGSSVLIHFKSDDLNSGRGFVLEYETVRAGLQVSHDGENLQAQNKSTPIRERLQVPANELVQEISADVTVAVGDEKMIKCIPTVPEASIQWLKDEALLNGSTPLTDLHVVSAGMLWIRRMNSALAGRYTCMVTTEDRQALTTAEVTMTETKERGDCDVYFHRSPKDQTLFYGEMAVMQCVAQPRQRPSSDVKISWLRNGQPLTTGRRYRDLGNGLVYITDVMPKDSAVYTCVATDLRNNCTVQESALLRVQPRVNIDDVCGTTPTVRRPTLLEPPRQEGKIVGGKDSVKGAHPWQVMFWSEDNSKPFCGGSLLNNQWAVTASHCFKSGEIRIDKVEVRLGKYDRTEDEPEQFVTRVADVHFHPVMDNSGLCSRFNGSTFDNDIALVQLADRVTFTDYILPACLGEDSTIERDVFSSGTTRLGVVTGWGQLTESGAALPRFLQEIALPVVDRETCRNSTTYFVTDNMFCAGYSQDVVGDACQGDSGGPFMVQEKNRWHLVGIVSWGVGCGRGGHYGYYTKVNNYHEWIKENIVF